ncbi:MAG: M90 family metallopeptidase [Pseudomonadota bacterium]
MWSWRNLWRSLWPQPAIPDGLWREALAHLPYCQMLGADTQARLRERVLRFLSAKTFEGAAGLRVTDRMRLRVALQACLLILNLDFDYYAGWHAVILYPGDFRVAKEHVDEAGVVHRWHEELSGESWEQGPVILSWDAAAAPSDAHTNIVLHEFAHKLDMRNGAADGCPPLPPELSSAAWTRDFLAAYEKLCVALDSGQPVRIDDYAAESPAEFFAVLSEAFFLMPTAVQSDFPAVYRQLVAFYRQDPLAVLKDWG